MNATIEKAIASLPITSSGMDAVNTTLWNHYTIDTIPGPVIHGFISMLCSEIDRIRDAFTICRDSVQIVDPGNTSVISTLAKAEEEATRGLHDAVTPIIRFSTPRRRWFRGSRHESEEDYALRKASAKDDAWAVIQLVIQHYIDNAEE